MLPYFQAGVLFWVVAGFVVGQYGAPPVNSYKSEYYPAAPMSYGPPPPPAPIPYGQLPQVVNVPVPGPMDFNQPDYTNVRGGKNHGAFLDAFVDNYRRHRDHKRRNHKKDRKDKKHKRNHRRSRSSSSSSEW